MNLPSHTWHCKGRKPCVWRPTQPLQARPAPPDGPGPSVGSHAPCPPASESRTPGCVPPEQGCFPAAALAMRRKPGLVFVVGAGPSVSFAGNRCWSAESTPCCRTALGRGDEEALLPFAFHAQSQNEAGPRTAVRTLASGPLRSALGQRRAERRLLQPGHLGRARPHRGSRLSEGGQRRPGAVHCSSFRR